MAKPPRTQFAEALPETLAYAQAQFDAARGEAPIERDPLAISLPPFLGSSGGALVAPETLRMLAAIYLNAELEQAGLLLAAELLADARFELPLASTEAARLLEDFHLRRRDVYTRPQRELLFARLFGVGGGAMAERGATVNHDFQRLLANFCQGVLSANEPLLPGGSPAVRQTFLRDCAQALAANLAARQFGNAVAAGRLLQNYTQQAVALLTHPGVLAHFQVRGLWDLLPRLFPDISPDIPRIVTRGQSGMRVLLFLAQSLAALTADLPVQMPVPGTADATAAAQWLQASGLVATH